MNSIDVLNSIKKDSAWEYFNSLINSVKQSICTGIIVVAETCEAQIHVESKETYEHYICSCGIRWRPMYSGTKEEVYEQINRDILDYKYQREGQAFY